MSEPLIDLDLFVKGGYNEINLMESQPVRVRRALALSHLAKSTFHPIPLQDTLRGEKSLRPKDYQLLPLDSFLTPWLSSLELGKGNTIHHSRKTLIVGDEGGMGKTYAAVLVAHRYLSANQSGTVVVLCPPLLAKQWSDEFARLGYRARICSAHKLVSGELEIGGVMIISKFSPMRNPLKSETSITVLKDRVELCILDEGHQGMIAGGADDNAQMRKGIRDVLLSSKRRLIATATPIRNDEEDLRALLTACLKDGDKDYSLINDFKFSPEWFNNLRTNWFPNLEKLYNGVLESKDIASIAELSAVMIPFIGVNQKEILKKALKEQLAEINGDEIKRTRLARDLHPLGKYFSISVRDDLGAENVKINYRKQISQTYCYEQSEKFKQIRTEVEAFGTHSWESCFSSCPMNAINSRYQKTFPDLIENSGLTKGSLETLWLKDPRLNEILKISKDLKDQSYLDEKVGIVVFCEWSGTVDRIEEWAKDIEESNSNVFNVFKLRGLDGTPDNQYMNQDDDSKQQRKHRIEQSKILENLHQTSSYNYDDSFAINLLICGPGVTVGHNMQWANRVIHWDLNFNSVENIAQKTWRLDRLIKGGGDNHEKISTDFKVHYFVQKDNSEKIADSNKKHQNNRLFLGDRRYTDYGGDKYPVLIPECGSKEKRSDTWNPSSKSIDYSDFEMQRFWKLVKGEENNVPGIAEVLGLHFLSETTGIELDLEDTDNMQPDHDNGFGVSERTFHDLITLAGVTERGSLQFLKGGYLRAKNAMSRFGASSNSSSLVLNLNPDGKLITRFATFLRDQSRSAEDITSSYAFTISADGSNNHEQFPDFNEDLNIGVHLGLIELKEDHRIWSLFKKLHGVNCPSGLIRRIDDGNWEHVMVSELNSPENKYSPILKHVLQLSNKNVYAQNIPNIQCAKDKSEFKKINSIKSIIDPLNINNFDDDDKWLAAITRLGEDLGTLLTFKTTYSENTMAQFLPVIRISKDFSQRTNCPVCQNTITGCDNDGNCSWKHDKHIGWN